MSTPEKILAGCIDQMNACESSFVEWAIKAGKILNEQKAKLGHGEWESWRKEHWTKGERTARTYMRLESSDIPVVQLIEAGSVRGAVNLIEDSNRQRAADLEDEKENQPKLNCDSGQPPIEGDIPDDAGPVDVQTNHRDEPPEEVYEDYEEDNLERGETVGIDNQELITTEPEDYMLAFAGLIKEMKRILPNVDATTAGMARKLIDSIHPPQSPNEIQINCDDPFEQFWKEFPSKRKRSKGDARKAWKKAVKVAEPIVIIRAAAEFAKSTEGNSEVCPGPTPWLNQERWADDREAWNRGDTTAPTFNEKRVSNTVDAVSQFLSNDGQARIEN